MQVCLAEPNCKGLKMKKPQCCLCIRVCKSRALTFDKELQLDPEKCNGCGLCHGICPNRNFQLTGSNLQALTEVEAKLRQGENKVELGCQPYGKFTCLGAIDQETLYKWLGLGLKHLIVKQGKCNECGRSGVALLELRLEKLMEIAKHSLRKFSYDLVDSQAPAKVEAHTDRRQFFRQMARTAAGVVLTLKDVEAPQDQEDVGRVSLSETRRELLTGPKLPFGLGLKVSSLCEPCRICSAFCPHGALTYAQVGQEQQLQFNSDLCTGCGFCLAACPKGALVKNVGALGRKVLATKVGVEPARGYWD